VSTFFPFLSNPAPEHHSPKEQPGLHAYPTTPWRSKKRSPIR
jgi:hypothetical protein